MTENSTPETSPADTPDNKPPFLGANDSPPEPTAPEDMPQVSPPVVVTDDAEPSDATVQVDPGPGDRPGLDPTPEATPAPDPTDSPVTDTPTSISSDPTPVDSTPDVSTTQDAPVGSDPAPDDAPVTPDPPSTPVEGDGSTSAPPQGAVGDVGNTGAVPTPNTPPAEGSYSTGVSDGTTADLPPGPAVVPDPDAATFNSATGDSTSETPPEAPESATGDTVATGHRDHESDDTVAENVPTDAPASLSTEWADLRADVTRIHDMIVELHQLVMTVAPAMEKVSEDVRTKGLGGLMSAIMGGMSSHKG